MRNIKKKASAAQEKGGERTSIKQHFYRNHMKTFEFMGQKLM